MAAASRWRRLVRLIGNIVHTSAHGYPADDVRPVTDRESGEHERRRPGAG